MSSPAKFADVHHSSKLILTACDIPTDILSPCNCHQKIGKETSGDVLQQYHIKNVNLLIVQNEIQHCLLELSTVI